MAREGGAVNGAVLRAPAVKRQFQGNLDNLRDMMEAGTL
jgi:hypothetical protein